MRTALPGANTTIFILFFSFSLFEAFSSGNWVLAALWLVVGLLFLRGDLVRRRR